VLLDGKPSVVSFVLNLVDSFMGKSTKFAIKLATKETDPASGIRIPASAS